MTRCPIRTKKRKKGNEQEDPVPVPFVIGAEAPATPAETEREHFSEQYPFRWIKMNPEPGIAAPTAGELIWSPDIESDGESTFSVPNVLPAKGMEDFVGEWHYFRIVNGDGSEMSREEMLAEGHIYDCAEIIITKDEIQLFAPSLDDSASVEVEFNPEDGSLKILNGSEGLPVLRLADNGMLILFIPAYNTSSGDMTAYLTREEP